MKERTMQHLSPVETSQFLRDNPNALFIDCRSEMEFLFVGHPVGAIHVSWHDGPDWEINLTSSARSASSPANRATGRWC